jgi:hypothetical protein
MIQPAGDQCLFFTFEMDTVIGFDEIGKLPEFLFLNNHDNLHALDDGKPKGTLLLYEIT